MTPDQEIKMLRRRLAMSTKYWMRAAKDALDGDTRELRNRVDLIEAGPLEIVLSGEDPMADSPDLLKRRLQSWQDYPASGRMAATREKAIAELTREIEAMEATCRRCGGEMQPGIAMGQTYTAGAPDFPSDTHGITVSAGGPGVVIEARKCSTCGWSVT